ncbi:hypothetical protein OIU84_022520 [Salix udensis]|uniref:Uncharacterized protein n=1 Tax=Salix udensis TaxID=889485 RepID=A0AAD6KP37_9ROSI|nr:hypothetical protein OIU84_022520 [Salix udensis]
MQRLSLGSPVTKLHPHGGADTLLCKNDTKPPSTSLSTDADDLDHKSTKRRRFSSSLPVLSPAPPKPEKLIHLIPFLILFCFLVLFLLSHTPSQSDLAQFNGSYNHIASESIDALNDNRTMASKRFFSEKAYVSVVAMKYVMSAPKVSDWNPAGEEESCVCKYVPRVDVRKASWKVGQHVLSDGIRISMLF